MPFQQPKPCKEAWTTIVFIPLSFSYLNCLTNCFLIIVDSVSLIFGAISMMSGLIGVSLGSGLGNFLQKKYPKIHPIICGVGMLLSFPFMLIAMLLIETHYTVPFVLIFFAQVALNLNWAIVADMCMVRTNVSSYSLYFSVHTSFYFSVSLLHQTNLYLSHWNLFIN